MGLVLVHREHWMHWLASWMLTFVTAFASVALLYFLPYIQDSSLHGVLFLASFAGAMASVHSIFILILSWDLSRNVLTLHEIIDFQYVPFVKHDSSLIQIDQISNVDRYKHGLLANIFNYGEVRLNLSHGLESFHLHYVPHPAIFVRAIDEVMALQRTNMASPKE